MGITNETVKFVFFESSCCERRMFEPPSFRSDRFRWNQWNVLDCVTFGLEFRRTLFVSKQLYANSITQTPGGVLNRNLCRVVRPTQRNPDPVEDAKDVNFATLSKRKCCNFLPCSRLDQAGRNQNNNNEAHEIGEDYVIEGGEKEKICWKDPV